MVVSANSISLAHLSIKRAKTRKPEARKGPIRLVGVTLARGFDAYSSQCCWLAISRSSFERRVGIIPLPFLRLLNAVLLEL